MENTSSSNENKDQYPLKYFCGYCKPFSIKNSLIFVMYPFVFQRRAKPISCGWFINNIISYFIFGLHFPDHFGFIMKQSQGWAWMRSHFLKYCDGVRTADGYKWAILLSSSSPVWGHWVILAICTFAASSSSSVTLTEFCSSFKNPSGCLFLQGKNLKADRL